MASVFEAFGPTVGLQLLFILFRAGLAMCHDFKFMAIASSVTFVVVYVPAIVCVRVISSQYTSTLFYVAMYLPHFVLVLVFGGRLIQNLLKLKRDQPGPWTYAQRTEEQSGLLLQEQDQNDYLQKSIQSFN